MGSPAFKHFLDFLGDRIRLKGWRRHRAGLDVKSTLNSLGSHTHTHFSTSYPLPSVPAAITADSTGTESYFTTFENFEVMFHVSTLLPLLPNDPSRVRAW